jgi:two-component system, sensor histidine kinase
MRLPDYYRNLPVTHKLRLASMITVIAALLLACVSLIIDDQIKDRARMGQDLGVLADIFSANSTAALSFNDPSAAKELLATLRAKQHITAAFLYSAEGKLFASYHREPNLKNTAAPSLRADGSLFDSQHLMVFKSILNDGQKIGTVALESDLGELIGQLQRFLWVILAAMLGASLVALVLSSMLQHGILQPIAHLASVARLVSASKRTMLPVRLNNLTTTWASSLILLMKCWAKYSSIATGWNRSWLSGLRNYLNPTPSSWWPKTKPSPPVVPRASS